MALAVNAMIGRRRKTVLPDHLHSFYPSISGIMISIKTMATSGVDSIMEIASRPVPAVKNAHSADVPARCSMRICSHVVVHNKNFLVDQGIRPSGAAGRAYLLLGGEIGDYSMQEQGCLIQQAFRRLDAFNDDTSRQYRGAMHRHPGRIASLSR